MADMYTPEEIQAIFDAYNDAIRRGIPITESMAKQMADATKGVKNYTDRLNISMNQLGQTTKQLGKNLANGTKGVSVFNDSLDAAGSAAANVATQFGPLGIAVGMVIKALTFFVTAATKQSDKLFETFQSISRTGAVGAQGMTDIFQSMKRFGYTIDELDKMTAVMAENSRDFALFGGTAATGGKRLSELVEGFQNARVNLQALGLSTDEQVRAAAGYYKQMGRLGRATDATSAGALEYIKEMETLTRLTGLQRKDLEAQREQAEQIDTFYASMMEMGQSERNAAYEVYSSLSAIDPKFGPAFAKTMNGIIDGSEEQQQLLFATNFQMIEWTQALKEGRMSAAQFKQSVSDAVAGNMGLAQNLSKVNSNFMGSLRSLNMLATKGLDPFARQTAEAAGQVEDLYNAVDPATKAQAQARVAQIDASNAMQSFINLGVVPATQALAYLSEVVETLTSILPGSKSRGYGRGGTGSMGGSLAATGAGAAAGAAAGSLLGPLGTVVGGAAGGLLGFAGYQMHGGAGAGAGAGGLRIKSGEATAGGAANPALMELAQQIQGKLGGDLKYFSAFNDSYHQGTNSAHARGAALDFTLTDPSKAAQIAAMIRGMPGVKYVQDEYSNPSSRATAGHIHAEINGAAGFRGMLSGPMSGYMPNMLMHGNEELSVRPMGGTSNSNAGASEGSIAKLIERVDDLIYVSKSQLSVNEKILKYQH